MRRLLPAAVAALTLVACGTTVDRPTSDTTPPEATIGVAGLPTNPAVPAAGADISIRTGETAVVLATARDDQGAMSVVLEGGYTAHCKAGTVKQGTLRETKVEPTASTQVPTVQAVQLNIGAEWASQACGGAAPDSVTGQLRAVASNFHGGTATSGWLRFGFRYGPRKLVVRTYNIHGTADPKKGIGEFADRLDGFAAALQGSDVALLQEVRAGQAEQVAAKLGMPYVAYGRTKNGSLADVATISRHPISAEQSHHPETPGCTFYCTKHEAVVFEVSVVVAALPVRITNLHLVPDGDDGNDRTEYRKRAADLVVQRVRQTSGPLVVGGDINAVPGSTPVTALLGVLTDPFATVPGAVDGTPRIDVLYYRAPLRAIGYEAVGSDPPVTTVTLTDHPKVTVTFEVAD